jgi:NADH-quinone oxidoreductase subunit H
MNEPLQSLFWLLVFPGFLFTVFAGLVASWIVRKVSALVQWRVGPPFFQPFLDVVKLQGNSCPAKCSADRFSDGADNRNGCGTAAFDNAAANNHRSGKNFRR